MVAHARFSGVLLLSVGLGTVLGQERPATKEATAATPGGTTAASPEPNQDARAIGDVLGLFIGAYNAKNATALGDLFTRDAEIEDDDGEVTRGRDAIVARFAKMFGDGQSGTLSVTTNSLRFLTKDLAIEEGTALLSGGGGAPPQTNRYSLIYARQDGRWLHARIRDEQPDEVSPREQLRQLEWMLGEWVNEGDDGIVKTHCKRSDHGNFLIRGFDVKVEGRISLSGTQRIGWDAQRKQFRMWVFDDRGGFAEGLMSRDGERWISRASGVRPDGQPVTVTTVFSPLGKDRILWEILERTVGGEVVPGTDRFYLVRRAPLPGK
jgi:uncharacterized protein (TIGR02246 family)